MTTDTDRPGSEEDGVLFERLAAYDDQLASGKFTSASLHPGKLDESQRNRLERMTKTVDLLRTVKATSRDAFFSERVPSPARQSLSSERSDPLPSQIGPFEILRELGRGGMGVVYLAEDRRLGRQVALKMLSAGLSATPDDADMGREEGASRLQREATILAQVRHPNVVEIYGAETFQDRPYLVMEYVPGGSLKDLLRENALPAKEAARMFAAVARGIQAVHDAGVIHRDLKPANVLINANGLPKVTDFGLARRLEINDGMTKTGEFLGTPRYMAPEQIRDDGGKTDKATDVYGLGITLYETLTGRAPFLGVLQIDLLNQILHQEPAAPRSVNPSIPRDLETVCLKCLEKKPSQRYASAQAVAEDLERFLEGMPLVARPVGKAERAWRWTLRNPALAGLFGVMGIGLAVAVGLVIALDRSVRAERETRKQLVGALGDVERSRDEARAEAERAEQNLLTARQAIAKVLFRFVEDPRFQEPEYLELRKQWLADSRPVFERFLAQKPDDPELLAEQARTHFAYGSLEASTGNPSGAVVHYREASEGYRKLLEKDGFLAEYAAKAGRALSHAALNMHKDDGSEIDAHKNAIDMLERACQAAPETGLYQMWLAEALAHYSSPLLMRRDFKELKKAQASILDITGQYIAKHGANIQVGDIRAVAYSLKAVTEAIADEHEASLRDRRQAVKIWEDVARMAEPSRKSFHNCRLAGGLTSLGIQLATVGQPGEANDAFNRSVHLLDIEVQLHPLNSGYLQLLVSALSHRGEVSMRNGKPESARTDFERADGLLRKLEAAEPNSPILSQFRSQVDNGLAKTAKPK